MLDKSLDVIASVFAAAFGGTWIYIFAKYFQRGSVTLVEDNLFIRTGELVTLCVVTAGLAVIMCRKVYLLFKVER